MYMRLSLRWWLSRLCSLCFVSVVVFEPSFVMCCVVSFSAFVTQESCLTYYAIIIFDYIRNHSFGQTITIVRDSRSRFLNYLSIKLFLSLQT